MQRQAERARTSVKEEHVSSVSASGRSSGKTIITVVLVIIAVLVGIIGWGLDPRRLGLGVRLHSVHEGNGSYTARVAT